jgi:glycerol-3-phosphate dehydrogenase
MISKFTQNMETIAKKFDIVIIGAGITGLLLMLKLTRLGKSVLLLEANNVIAQGPSTRNEGWIHAGSYHAYGIDDEKAAIRVAKNCLYGYNQIKSAYPECVEEPFTESVVLIKKIENCHKAEWRWTKAGVFFERLKGTELIEILHDVNIPAGAIGYRVAEKAINTRILYQRILQEIKINSDVYPKSVCIRTGVKEITFTADKKTILIQHNNGKSLVVNTKMVIYTSGTGTKAIYDREHPEINCPLRVFESHLLITKRMSENNVFFVEEDEITAMGHNEMTIIGSTKDNDEIRAEKNLDEAQKLRKERLVERTRSLFKNEMKEFEVYSCHKVDIGETKGFQSLEPKIYEDPAMPNHIICCPGKMTEAPILVDNLINKIFARLDNSIIAKRPCDNFGKNQ